LTQKYTPMFLEELANYLEKLGEKEIKKGVVYELESISFRMGHPRLMPIKVL